MPRPCADSAIMTSTILVPYPGIVAISAIAGTALNPFLVGIFAGLGAGAGELTGYGLGYGGGKLLSKNMKKPIFRRQWKHTERLFHKYGGVLIFILAVTPLPDDILGMICGAIHYDVIKFYLWATAGKTVLYTVFAVTGNVLFS